MAIRIPVETPPNETRPLPYGCNAYRFDGLGKCFPKGWDLAEGRGREFCWYHVALHDGGATLKSLDYKLKVLCPPLEPQDITRMVSSGPFCGHVDGALFIRVNSSGPALNKSNLRFAARVTERRVITVSLGLNPTLGLSPSDIHEDPNLVRNDKMAGPSRIVIEEGDHPENPKLVGNDEIAAPAENEEGDPESKLATNLKEPDNWAPKTVGNLLVRILYSHVEHLQNFVTKLETDVDKVEAAMDWEALLLDTLEGETDNVAVRGDIWHNRRLTKMNLNLQRLVQVFAHVELVFPLIKETCAPNSWLAKEDILSLDGVIGRLRRLKETVGSINSRVRTIQAEVDSRQAEVINRKLYYLSSISVIFLPLSFITGVFGMSVGGMPWTGQEDGFRKVFLVCGLTLVVLLACCMFRVLYKCIKPQGFSLKQLGQRILWKITRRILRIPHVIVACVRMCVVYGKLALQTHFSAGIEH